MSDVFAPNGGPFIALLARYAAGKGHNVLASLQQEATSSDRGSAVVQALPVHEHAMVLDAAEDLLAAPDIGYTLARACALRDAGLTGYAIGASSTLRQALQTLTRLSGQFRIILPGAPFGPAAGYADLQWDYGAQGQLNLRHWSEFTAAFLIRTLKDLSGGQVSPVQVDFMHSEHVPAQVARSALGVAPGYRARVNRICYRERDLDQPLQSADPGLLRLLMEHAELLERVDTLAQNSLSITVERLIMDGMSDGEASLAKVAELLDMSQRTLSRKLASEGTSFFAILEGVRKSLALRYLRQNEKSLSEISFLLGYSSLSSFNDAFRRWTDQSPGSYRSAATKSP
ncbi:AraC family transcriptional regulator [Epibacterium sp. MM17-32]|uniref:helix-turn-helix transcriptional regulator n=1 Tax=Epibacterium sp. MM17-32 TaxID=2917734 RepID=UPI001EF5CD07|nr:AraC family transcriptional regulator [Epibacterium sp. MM17-32]MCG7628916.1 AraC family transcriptional regulator [Epibacterium sp. MM17-32]